MRTRRLNPPKPQIEANISRLAKVYRDFFAQKAVTVAHQIAPLITRVLQPAGDVLFKADEPPSDEEVQRIIDAIRLGDWDVLTNPTEAEIAAVTAGGIRAALKILGFEGGDTTLNEARANLGLDPVDGGGDVPAIVNQVNTRSVAYAKERAADLVTQISENTRDMLRATVADAVEGGWGAQKLADEIAESPAFSDDRAMLIARTELIAANNFGNLDAYRDSGGIVKMKEWKTAGDDLVSEGCQENEDEGPIDVDDVFPSGDDAPPAHPNCRCALVPVTELPSGEEVEGEEEDLGEAAHSQPIQRYSEDQPRDDHGRFAGGGSGGSTAAPAKPEPLYQMDQISNRDQLGLQSYVNGNPDLVNNPLRGVGEGSAQFAHAWYSRGAEQTPENQAKAAKFGELADRIEQGREGDPEKLYGALRDLDKELSQSGTDATVRMLDNAFGKLTTAEPLDVFRGTKWGHLADLENPVGKTLTFPEFMSTSHSEDIARSFGGRTPGIMEIHIPSGSHAADMHQALGSWYERGYGGGLGAHRDENEVLLDRGSSFRVTSYDPDSRRIGLELVSQRSHGSAKAAAGDTPKLTLSEDDDRSGRFMEDGDRLAAMLNAATKLKPAAKYSEDQPRDERGRWAPGGGGGEGKEPKEPEGAGRSATVTSDLYDRETDHSMTGPAGTEKYMASLLPELRANFADVEQQIKTEGTTASLYRNADGTWPERDELHAQIASRFFTPEAMAAATPPPGEKPTFTMLGGRGGSGKSWLTREGGPVDKSKAILLDNDRIKSMIPEFKGWNAANVHEESDHIFKAMTDFAMKQGLNVIQDATMKSPNVSQGYIDQFKGAGYDAKGYYMFLPPDKAVGRGVDRYLSAKSMEETNKERAGWGLKPVETGRYVPPSYILGSTQNERSFDQVKGNFSHWEVYNNNVPRGTDPKHVASGGS